MLINVEDDDEEEVKKVRKADRKSFDSFIEEEEEMEVYLWFLISGFNCVIGIYIYCMVFRKRKVLGREMREKDDFKEIWD